jgi:hypothetical protein
VRAAAAAGAAALGLVLGACSAGDGAPRPAATTTTTVADVTVRGVVASVSASAKVIAFAAPVAGVTNVALTVDSQILRATGGPATLADVAPGTTVEATGRPSGADTIVARRLVVS